MDKQITVKKKNTTLWWGIAIAVALAVLVFKGIFANAGQQYNLAKDKVRISEVVIGQYKGQYSSAR